MAPLLDAEVLVVNAMSPVGYLVPAASPAEVPPIIDDSAIEESVHHELESELETWCAPLRDAGVPYQSHVVDGSVIDALLGVRSTVASRRSCSAACPATCRTRAHGRW
jgi:hypothetical protein